MYTAYENGVLVWYDSVRELNNLLDEVIKLSTEPKLAADAQRIKQGIQDSQEKVFKPNKESV